jgi:hypothetical protein
VKSRRFPPPWSVEERTESFIVKDAKGQPLAYVYFEDEPRPKTRSSVVSATLLDSVPAKAQPKNKQDASPGVRAFNQENRHVEGSKKQ